MKYTLLSLMLLIMTIFAILLGGITQPNGDTIAVKYPVVSYHLDTHITFVSDDITLVEHNHSFYSKGE